MTNKEYLSISKSEALAAGRKCYQNAKDHSMVAESAAAIGKYAIASSLLILSVEECVKGMLFLARFLNVNLEFEVDPYFRHHSTKHGEAAEIQQVMNILSQTELLLTRDPKMPEDRSRTVFDTTLSLVVAIVLEKAYEAIGQKNQDFKQWWERANDQKNNGFYVGYFHGQWNFPSDAPASTYEKTLKVTRPFIDVMRVTDWLEEKDSLMFTDEG